MIFKYIAGNNFHKALSISNKIIRQHKIPIINFAVENSINQDIIIKEFNNIEENVNSNCKLAIKLSLFNFDKNIIKTILTKLCNKNIQILIDAENNTNYDAYNNLTNDLITEYNEEKLNIIKTYQMYRKDSLRNIDDDLHP